MKLRYAVCAMVMVLVALTAFGQQSASDSLSLSVVPQWVKFSGVARDVGGRPLDGTLGITFALYEDQQSGPPLWLETQSVQTDAHGNYTVQLGATRANGLPAELFASGKARWLGVQVQGQAEQPRVLLLSVPYALKAADAQTVGGLPASAFVLAAPPAASAGSTTSPAVTTQPLVTGTTPVTTAGGTVNKLAKFDAAADVTSSQVFDNGTNVGIGTVTPSAKLDVKGSSTVRGLLSLPTKGTATATTAYTSQPLKLTASSFNSATAAAVAQNFQWQAEATGNNTSSASGTLNLLYASGTNALAETGLKIASNGRITFAAGQAFPGTGTITGVTAGTDLTGGGTSGIVKLNLDTTRVPQLAAANTFTAGQRINSGSGPGLQVSSAGTIANPQLQLSQTNSGDFSRLRFASGSQPVWDVAVGGAGDVMNFWYGNSGNIISLAPTGLTMNIGGTGKNDALVIGNWGSRALALFDTGTQVDIASQGVPLNINFSGQWTLFNGSASPTGYVGIGTVTPQYMLDVNGNARISGNLIKGGGSFKIDHPLDPANKYLSHSFVESPDMMNIYNGNVVTDKHGLATIELPDWFEALNRDFRYQLTVIGQFAQAIVVQKVKNNHFTLKTNKPGVEVSWQVTGIRQDAYANAHRIPVEEVKPAQEQGHYLHPELFGAGPDKAIGVRAPEPSKWAPTQAASLTP